LLDEIEDDYRVDKNRIYITGLSMGGHGTWTPHLLSQPDLPQLYRYVVGVILLNFKNSNKPIWIFHGAKDFVVPVSASEQMFEKLKSCGGTDVVYNLSGS
jgi:predicted peptidase